MNKIDSWSTQKKWLFRFSFTYVLLYILPIPYTFFISLPDYLFSSSELNLLITELLLSLVITIVWSFTDTERPHYSFLIYWFQFMLRAFIFINMMIYGFVKVAALQFGAPTLIQLITPVGELAPMRLLWIFMGYSTIYQVFAGLLEVAGGFLMLFRKTTTLGALLTAGVISNVVLMNFLFDIPVKGLSSHLFFFALMLAAFDFQRILNVFILNKKTDPESYSEPVQASWFTVVTIWFQRIMTGLVIAGLLICAILPFTSFSSLFAKKSELYGLYKVTDQESSLSENAWKYFVMDAENNSYIRYEMNTKSFLCELDTINKNITLRPRETGSDREFSYNSEDNLLYLTEVVDGDTLQFTMEKVDELQFQLMK